MQELEYDINGRCKDQISSYKSVHCFNGATSCAKNVSEEIQNQANIVLRRVAVGELLQIRAYEPRGKAEYSVYVNEKHGEDFRAS